MAEQKNEWIKMSRWLDQHVYHANSVLLDIHYTRLCPWVDFFPILRILEQ